MEPQQSIVPTPVNKSPRDVVDDVIDKNNLEMDLDPDADVSGEERSIVKDAAEITDILVEQRRLSSSSQGSSTVSKSLRLPISFKSVPRTEAARSHPSPGGGIGGETALLAPLGASKSSPVIASEEVLLSSGRPSREPAEEGSSADEQHQRLHAGSTPLDAGFTRPRRISARAAVEGAWTGGGTQQEQEHDSVTGGLARPAGEGPPRTSPSQEHQGPPFSTTAPTILTRKVSNKTIWDAGDPPSEVDLFFPPSSPTSIGGRRRSVEDVLTKRAAPSMGGRAPVLEQRTIKEEPPSGLRRSLKDHQDFDAPSENLELLANLLVERASSKGSVVSASSSRHAGTGSSRRLEEKYGPSPSASFSWEQSRDELLCQEHAAGVPPGQADGFLAQIPPLADQQETQRGVSHSTGDRGGASSSEDTASKSSRLSDYPSKSATRSKSTSKGSAAISGRSSSKESFATNQTSVSFVDAVRML